MGFSDTMFQYHRDESVFTDAICDADFGEFNRVGGDSYDNSIEFYEVTDDFRINEAAQRIIFEAGFSRCWTNHHDGSEWYYSWGEEFRYTEGCQHKKPKAAVTTSSTTGPILTSNG